MRSPSECLRRKIFRYYTLILSSERYFYCFHIIMSLLCVWWMMLMIVHVLFGCSETFNNSKTFIAILPLRLLILRSETFNNSKTFIANMPLRLLSLYCFYRYGDRIERKATGFTPLCIICETYVEEVYFILMNLICINCLKSSKPCSDYGKLSRLILQEDKVLILHCSILKFIMPGLKTADLFLWQHMG